jgi:competence protein ComGC
MENRSNGLWLGIGMIVLAAVAVAVFALSGTAGQPPEGVKDKAKDPGRVVMDLQGGKDLEDIFGLMPFLDEEIVKAYLKKEVGGDAMLIIDGLWKSLELGSVHYYASLTDFRSGSSTLRIGGGKGKIWDMIDLPCDKSKALKMVPADAPFYARIAVGDINELIKKWADWAKANKDTAWGKAARLEIFLHEITKENEAVTFFIKHKVREFALFCKNAYDFERGPVIVFRFETPADAKAALESQFFLSGFDSEHGGKYKTSVNDMGGGKLYTITHEDELPVYAGLHGGCFSIGRTRKNIEESLNAAGSGKNAAADTPACTAMLAVNIKRMIPDTGGPGPLAPVAVFKDFTWIMTFEKKADSVEIKCNMPVGVFTVPSIIAAIAIPNLLSAMKAGRETSGLASMKAVQSAQVMHKRKNNTYANLDALTANNLLPENFKEGMIKDGFKITTAGGTDAYKATSMPLPFP